MQKRDFILRGVGLILRSRQGKYFLIEGPASYYLLNIWIRIQNKLKS